MTPGSPPRAAGDHSSLETRGQEGDPVLKGRAMEELLEGLWKLRGSGQPQRPGQQKTSRIARVQRRTAEGWWPGGEGRRGGPPPSGGAACGVTEVLSGWTAARVAALAARVTAPELRA